MPKRSKTYFVAMRDEMRPHEAHLFNQFAQRLRCDDSGGSLFVLTCTRIDLSHHHFAKLWPKQEHAEEIGYVPTPLWVPHEFILFIADEANAHTFGFDLDPNPFK